MDTVVATNNDKKRSEDQKEESDKNGEHLHGILENDDNKLRRRSSLLTTEEQQRLLQHALSIWQGQEEEEEQVDEEEWKPLPTLPSKRRQSLVRPGSSGKASQSYKSAVRFSINCQDCSYVRRPSLYSLVKSPTFQAFKYRYANAQVKRTLVHPTLPQPPTTVSSQSHEQSSHNEMKPTRPSHRFVITADTQFGILMDGIPMEDPNWNAEKEYSRLAVEKINAMRPKPLFVCVCGDLVDTESSFCAAMPTWKKVMKEWECHAVQQQQFQDWKQIWAKLDEDIALVCLCGNHDVGNRPTRASIQAFTKEFGDDYLAFWANGTYNIALNNCLFFDPTGAPALFDAQVDWLQNQLEYAKQSEATHIFVFGHFPWFLYHEDEADDDIDSASYPPAGWGAPGAAFADSYFNIPLEYRKIGLDLFKQYGVTACFSGHFHQNLSSKASWGMDMIITGPLSMLLKSNHSLKTTTNNHEKEEPNELGMRLVDVDDVGFRHEFVLLGEEAQ